MVEADIMLLQQDWWTSSSRVDYRYPITIAAQGEDVRSHSRKRREYNSFDGTVRDFDDILDTRQLHCFNLYAKDVLQGTHITLNDLLVGIITQGKLPPHSYSRS
jgi:hypothetical protein